MVTKLLKVFGDSNDKYLKRLSWVINDVNRLENEFQKLTDDELKNKTNSYRERISKGELLDALIPEAFASVREAARRSLGMRHFDVQLIGGLVLHQGSVAEMRTGEGKTLVATLPLFLNAISGEGVHLVTVNDYLARRDARWMGPIYDLLGLKVGCLQHDSAFIYQKGSSSANSTLDEFVEVERREAYLADITYGTNNEFGFDFLRDNMAAAAGKQVQRKLNYAIVDEVDNILIDEARTPLIISGPAEESGQEYQQFSRIAPRLKEGIDYSIEAKEKQVILTQEGIERIEKLLQVDNLYDPENSMMAHYVDNALRAQFIHLKDREYVVQNKQIIIVDEFTGRLMPGRRYSDGLHQAIEAKEGVAVQRETMTYATITLQNYFRMYSKLSGMTGTAVTEAEEFHKVYDLDVVAVPTNQPLIRNDLPDLIYKNELNKFVAVAEEITSLHKDGRPVLVGTVSIERSEQLSNLLSKRGVPHEILNAKNHEREAQIIADAGKPGAVTVSTSMAGRGTDIILGGDPKSAISDETWHEGHSLVVGQGGLFVIGTERHDSRRIDNQLRGRAGRQGDPGTTRFYGSLEDDIIKRFGGSTMGRIVNATLPDDVPLESGLLTKTMEMTQSKVEAHHFDIRKHLVEYDDVVNTQRSVIYSERMKILSDFDMQASIMEMVGSEVTLVLKNYLHGDPADWEIEPMLRDIGYIFPLPKWLNQEFLEIKDENSIEDSILQAAESMYESRELEFGSETMRALERIILLQTTDRLWVQHLTQMSTLREGIGLHAYGQRDPLVMYKKEGHEQFDSLRNRIRSNVARTIFYVAPAGHNAQRKSHVDNNSANRNLNLNTSEPETVMAKAVATKKGTITTGQKIGRNDPCWCNSGKKFKRCHGLN